MEMEKLNQCIEDVLDFDYQHLTTDDSDGRSFYFALKRLEDYYENLKEVESPVPPKDHIGACDSVTVKDPVLDMSRIYEGLIKTEDQIKQEQTISKFPEEALKPTVPTSLSGSSKNTQPKKEYDAEFKDGDEVWHIQYGNGRVIDVDRNLSKFSAPYPIKVVFPHDTMRFTAGGKDRAEDRARTLFHGHDLKVTVNEKKPERGKKNMKCSRCGSESLSIERHFNGMRTCKDCGFKEINAPQKDHIVLTNNEDRWYKPCMCCVCKAISICTPTHDFYVTHDHGDKLICEQCYCEYLGQRLNYSDRQDTE